MLYILPRKVAHAYAMLGIGSLEKVAVVVPRWVRGGFILFSVRRVGQGCIMQTKEKLHVPPASRMLLQTEATVSSSILVGTLLCFTTWR